MNPKTLLPVILAIILLKPFHSSGQAVNTQDSLALVDLYNSAGGPNWINHTSWLTTAPVWSWYGIYVDTNEENRVRIIALSGNNVVGTVPSSLATIPFWSINLQYNRLSGSIPAAFNNQSESVFLDFFHNQLGGIIPSFQNLAADQYPLPDKYSFQN